MTMPMPERNMWGRPVLAHQRIGKHGERAGRPTADEACQRCGEGWSMMGTTGSPTGTRRGIVSSPQVEMERTGKVWTSQRAHSAPMLSSGSKALRRRRHEARTQPED